jgi:CHAT domain-containing protein
LNPAAASAIDRRARAWALKADCYAAWHTEPQRAATLATSLQALAAEDGADTELQALAAWTAGIAALAAGDLAAADAALLGAHAAFIAGGDPQHAAETQVPRMVALAMAGRDAAALACGEAALAQFLAVGDLRSAAKIQVNLGTMLSRQDRHVDAEPFFRRAAVDLARVGDVEGSIAADGALAYALAYQFRFDEALQANERARLRAEQHGFGVLQAQALQNIGRIELHRGRWHRALPALAEAAERMAAAGAPPLRQLESEAALADAYLAVSLLAEATQIYDGVIAQAASLGAPTEEAWATLQRARALAGQGDADGARAGFLRAAALYRDQHNAASEAFCTLGLARVELDQAQAAAALASAQAAAAALAGGPIVGWQLEAQALAAAAHAALGDAAAARAGFEALLQAADGLPALRMAALAGLGRLAARAGQAAAARAALGEALALVEHERAALPDDEFRSALGAEVEQVHADLIALSVSEGDPARLLADIELGRARALALSLADRVGSAPPETARLRWLRAQWRQAMAEGQTPRLPALAGEVQALERALLEGHRRAVLRPETRGGARDLPASPALRPPASLAPALMQALPHDQALLLWHRQGAQLVACIVTDEGVTHWVWPAADLDARLQGLRFQIDTLRHGGPALRQHAARLMSRVQDHAQALHALLWAPLLPLLGGRRRVVVVPHRELHYLPFAALHDGRHWLVQTHTLSLAASAHVWLAGQAAAARSAVPIAGSRVLAFGVAGTELPQVADELAAVAAVHGPRAALRLDGQATLAALAAEAPSADLLHLACHGRFRADNPAFSCLQLGDGPLTMQDVRALRLRARLVVLSACETGLSRVAPGDELLGLVRAFTLAGAGAVMASLWPVDDGATAWLLADMHQALREGLSPAQALQQAQAAAAAAGEHPFHWAAFSLHGQG